MNKKEKAVSALLAVFPTLETFVAFAANSENAGTLKSFLEYGTRNGITVSGDPRDMEDFIRRNALPPEACQPPLDLTLEELLDRKEDFLKISLSERNMANRINTVLADQQIDLPRISNSMLTRMKKGPADTLHKQNILKALAFWLGHERADLGPQWNYETLRKLCPEASVLQQSYSEGIRIGFSPYSRGEVIDNEIIEWLKKALKHYIEKSLSHFSGGRWGKVRSYDITTLFVDFPKEDNTEDPLSYSLCLRSAIALAHHMAISWALSKYNNRKRFLAIGLVVGEYASVDNYLLPTLNARLSGDPVIRVTDYVRELLLINNIRVILSEQPQEAFLFNGESVKVWWVASFSSALYFNFIPELSEDPALKNDPRGKEARLDLLFFRKAISDNTLEYSSSNAIRTFFKFPNETLLGVEIAKILLFRQNFQESLEVLRIVLNSTPQDFAARLLRLLIHYNLALRAPSYSVSEDLLESAELEGNYIVENCYDISEDFLCEVSQIHFAKAMQTLKFARLGGGSFDGRHNLEETKQVVFAALKKAIVFSKKAAMVSSIPIRSSYLLMCYKLLKAILEDDESLFCDSSKSINSRSAVVREALLKMGWRLLGDMLTNCSPGYQRNFMKNLIMRGTMLSDPILLAAYQAANNYSMAISLWDFSPVRTVGTARTAIKLLNDSKEIGHAIAVKDDVCIYSMTRVHGEVMPLEQFVEHVEKAIGMIEELAGNNLDKRADTELIEKRDDRSHLLLTLNL